MPCRCPVAHKRKYQPLQVFGASCQQVSTMVSAGHLYSSLRVPKKTALTHTFRLPVPLVLFTIWTTGRCLGPSPPLRLATIIWFLLWLSLYPVLGATVSCQGPGVNCPPTFPLRRGTLATCSFFLATKKSWVVISRPSFPPDAPPHHYSVADRLVGLLGHCRRLLNRESQKNQAGRGLVCP